MAQDYILVNDVKYPLRIYLENRNSSRVSIVKSGVNIRLPRGMREKDIEKQILQYKDWAIEKLKARKESQPKQKIYKNGDELKVGTKKYTIKITKSSRKTHGYKLEDNWIILNLSKTQKSDQPKIKRLISRAVADDWRPWLEQRVEELNKSSFNQTINQIHIKYNKSNWGSCSSRSNINISTRLFFAPPEVIDYVIVHELAHLIEHNHSLRFWALVSKAIPDYNDKRKWLKENFRKCDF
ncbi:MAG: M48 family metallopeptidase [Spirochaetales bacterium]|nr:M48 family metallopeptidase [Spirochaetales bacterium]